MDSKRFKDFSKDAQQNPKVSYGFEESRHFKDVINEIYQDVSKLQYYTLDGRFEDILIRLLKDPKYETEGYSILLKDIEEELKKLVVSNVMLLPINFIKSSEIKEDLVLNDYIHLFIPKQDDLRNFGDFELNIRQEKRRKDKKHKFDDNLCKYFEEKLNSKLDKEHILLVKDREFFNYPILSIYVKNIDFKVEKESGRIAEAVYSFLRMLDFIKRKPDYSWGLLDKSWAEPAHTYVVYYNKENPNGIPNWDNSYYGYSFRFNFSYFLDINTNCFIENIDLFVSLIDLYIQTCFLDIRDYSSVEINIINKWNNAVLMFNTAFEFASIEKYDACVLMLCSIMESLFLKNEGRNKLEKLLEEVNMFAQSMYSQEKLERIAKAIRSAHKFRNKIMHEGRGYEVEFLSSRSLTSYQGIYRGMKPFTYQGAVPPHEEIVDIMIVFKFIINVLIGEKFTNNINNLLKKK